jgi:coproporphyrinogen III oxidase-like Fe-S oxidoreductase
MAHLQPRFPEGGARPHRVRLTAMRGFMPDTESLTGEQVRAIWADRFVAKGPGHPFWLYTHVPFCPQICTFCQCSTSLKKSDRQVERYLDWLEGEIDHLADTACDGAVRFQYVGGGTPNLLSEPQLERLLGTLNRRFTFAPGSRRTFEFLPSGLRPETLPLVRSFGFNRLSCGVQSWSSETLKAVNRSQAGLDEIGRTIQGAYELGFDEVNLDLIHGIGHETSGDFLAGLLEVLARRPTTVTIHHVIPTATNPVFATVEEELAAHANFETLEARLGAAVARRFPDVQWVLRPNSWVLVDRSFRQSGSFSLWYYSDNERIHIDMLSFGRFAHSNVLGQVLYENLSQADRYDPHEASYRTFRKAPVVDAALDLITDLVGDRRSDLAPIRARHGAAALAPLEAALERLRDEGRVAVRDGGWDAVETDGVFIDPFWPILETAMQEMSASWTVPLGKQADDAITIGSGERVLLVFIERISPDKRYFCELGRLGIYYRHPDPTRAPAEGDWIEALMGRFLDRVRPLVERVPTISPRAATAHLRRELAAADRTA